MNVQGALALRAEVLGRTASTCEDSVLAGSAAITAALSSGRTIFFMGNGGSAAQAQHLAAELVGRFSKERRGLPAVALTVDSSILTAVGNDYDFGRIFARQIEALAHPGDVVVGISTSGRSPNVLEGLRAARNRGAVCIGLTGASGGAMADLCDVTVRVPTEVTAVIQELHAVVGHLLCEAVDEAF